MMYILKKRCIHTDTNLKAHVQPKHNASIPGTACTWYISFWNFYGHVVQVKQVLPSTTTQHTNTHNLNTIQFNLAQHRRFIWSDNEGKTF